MAMSKIFTYNNIWLLGNCPCLSWTSRNCLLRINLKTTTKCITIEKVLAINHFKKFLKNLVGKLEHPFLGHSGRKFPRATEHLKR